MAPLNQVAQHAHAAITSDLATAIACAASLPIKQQTGVNPASYVARNIEIKARLHDIAGARDTARQLADGPPEVLDQVDYFFAAETGKLKLRTFTGEQPQRQGELIWYRRAEGREPRPSDYTIAPTSEPDAMLAILSAVLPAAGVVRKRRMVYLAGRTRIHLDEVEDLGTFLEFEVVMDEGEDEVAARGEARRLMEAFGIAEGDLLDRSYVDMLEGGKD